MTTNGRTEDPIDTFADAARGFTQLVATVPPSAWDGPGLGDWDLRSLVGHASRAVITVITYLGRPASTEELPDAASYVASIRGILAADAAAITERGRQAGVALGADPAVAIEELVEQAAGLTRAAQGDPVIETIGGGMRLSRYLPTRTFELVVHSQDIADAIRADYRPPAAALADSLHLAVEVALQLGEGSTVLAALTGRRSLPPGYTVV